MTTAHNANRYRAGCRCDACYRAMRLDANLRRLEDQRLAERLRDHFERNAIAQGHDRPTRDGLGLKRTA